MFIKDINLCDERSSILKKIHPCINIKLPFTVNKLILHIIFNFIVIFRIFVLSSMNDYIFSIIITNLKFAFLMLILYLILKINSKLLWTDNDVKFTMKNVYVFKSIIHVLKFLNTNINVFLTTLMPSFSSLFNFYFLLF